VWRMSWCQAMRRRAHLHIYGHVQGVSFRYSARRQARSLGLIGWVRNCPDGSVELVVEGEDDAMSSFLSWAHRGPSGAYVERIDVEDLPPESDSATFRIVG
jgi:acylphosphatase